MFVYDKSKDKYNGCISMNIKNRQIHSNRKDKFSENLAEKGEGTTYLMSINLIYNFKKFKR